MGARGRKSAASLEIAAIGPSGIQTIRRPDPPEELTAEQAEEWRAVVNRLPADWFPRETHGMLAQYCRHVVAARRVSQMIQALEEEMAQAAEEGTDRASILLSAAKAMDRLYKMQEREGRALSSLATRMRITQQATYDPKRKKGTQHRKPWETD